MSRIKPQRQDLSVRDDHDGNTGSPVAGIGKAPAVTTEGRATKAFLTLHGIAFILFTITASAFLPACLLFEILAYVNNSSDFITPLIVSLEWVGLPAASLFVIWAALLWGGVKLGIRQAR
jgi:hypothetical protein